MLRVFTERAAGRGYQKIAKALMADGVPSPSGNAKWQPTQIGSMLANETYTGKLVWGRERRAVVAGEHKILKGTERVERDKPDWRIVSDELWQKAQAVTAASAPSVAKRWESRSGGLIASHLLKPFLSCGVCGATVHVKVDKRHAGAKSAAVIMCHARHALGEQGCKNTMRVPYPWAEKAVLDHVKDVLAPRVIAEMVTESVAQAKRGQEDPAPIQREATKVKAEIANLVKLAAKTGDEGILDGLAERRAALAKLETRLATPTLAVDPAKLIAKVNAAVADWKRELHVNPSSATALLRQIMPERAAIAPAPDGKGWTYETRVDPTLAAYGEPEARKIIEQIRSLEAYAIPSASAARRGGRRGT